MKTNISKIRMEEGLISFVKEEAIQMKPDEFRIRYKSLLKTLGTLGIEKLKMEEISKKLKIELNQEK